MQPQIYLLHCCAMQFDRETLKVTLCPVIVVGRPAGRKEGTHLEKQLIVQTKVEGQETKAVTV